MRITNYKPDDKLPRMALLLWSAAAVALIVAAPLAASAVRPEGWIIQQAFGAFCHQQPGRSWHLQGQPLAVCARCFGVYAGVFLAAAIGLRLPAKALAAALAAVALSWVVEFTGLAAVSNGIRCLTGLALGASAGAVLLSWASARGARRHPCVAPALAGRR